MGLKFNVILTKLNVISFSSSLTCLELAKNTNLNLSKKRIIPVTRRDYLDALNLIKPQSPENSKSLKIAIIGPPNAGKSSLVNMLANWRACGVAGKSHTTRSKQNVIYTDESKGVQLVFVDLPGLISRRKIIRQKMEKSFIRDPHSAIFESDIIAVIVDVSHKNSLDSIDSEVLKLLHFFNDKESILIINKIDRMIKRRTRLLEVVRKLTKGIVGGRISHLDAFVNRQKERQKLLESDIIPNRLIAPQDIIFALLPPEAHQYAQNLLAEIESIRIENSVVHQELPKQLTPLEADSNLLSINEKSDKKRPHVIDINQSHTKLNREITEIDRECIDIFLKNYEPQSFEETTQRSTKSEDSIEDLDLVVVNEDNITQLYAESLYEQLKSQLLLKSASIEEIQLRRQRWKQLSSELVSFRSWTGFSEVFLVSSLTGEGIDNLREKLVAKAKPGLWNYNPALVTDRQPENLIRMAFWAHSLDHLPKELPYKIRIAVNDCEKALDDCGNETIYAHIRILCSCERHMKMLLGVKGSGIATLSNSVQNELSKMLGQNTIIKISCERKGLPGHIRRAFKRSSDFAEVFPDFKN